MSRFRWPGAARRFWWADYRMWAEVWDTVIARDLAQGEAVAIEDPDPATAELPISGSWSDCHGPGRCPRCCRWLRGEDQYIFSVRGRGDADPLAVVILCGECTREVLSAWRRRA